MLVVDCASGGTVRPTFVDVRTGATSEPPGLADLVSYQHAAGADGDAPAFESEAVGSRWLRIAVASSHSEEHVFLDWRFGRFVAQEPRLSDTTVESLDTPSRTARLCRPLEVRRGAAREPGRATLFSYAYRAPWLVWVDRLRARSVTTIQRCGRRARSLGAGTPVLLTRRYVAWISRGRLDLRYLATGRRSSVALPEGRRTGALVGTDHRLFLSQSFLDQVYARDLP
jgi:hypothetical protein